jgi:hypothetical protein
VSTNSNDNPSAPTTTGQTIMPTTIPGIFPSPFNVGQSPNIGMQGYNPYSLLGGLFGGQNLGLQPQPFIVHSFGTGLVCFTPLVDPLAQLGQQGPFGLLGLLGQQGPFGMLGQQSPFGLLGQQSPFGMLGQQSPFGQQGPFGMVNPLNLLNPLTPFGMVSPLSPFGQYGQMTRPY